MTEKKSSKGVVGIVIGITVIAAVVLFLFVKGNSEKEYTVTFQSDGGTEVKPIKVKENETVEAPADPKRDGYTFDGWYYDGKIFDFYTKITKDITLKAHWLEEVIELKETKILLLVGGEDKIEIVSLPAGVTEENLEYFSSDESVVTVDGNGSLKAIKQGKATITIRTKDGKYAATCEVTVEITVPEKDVTVESTYEVTIIALENKIDGSIRDARVVVTKDGKTFEDWSSMILYYPGSSKYLTKGNYLREFNDKTFTKVTITLKNGQKVETTAIKKRTEELQQ